MPRNDDYKRQFKKTLKEYERTAKKWQRNRNRYWEKHGALPYVAGGRKSDMTYAQRALTDTQRYFQYGIPGSRYKPVEKIRNMAEAERLITRMKQELTPEFARKRQQNLRRDLTERAQRINARRLLGIMDAVTDSELMRVYEQSDFADLLYVPSSDEQLSPELEQALIDTIRSVLSQTSETAVKRLSKREQRILKIEQHEALNRNLEKQQRRELAAKGNTREEKKQWLKSYAVRPDGAPANWYEHFEDYL